jgi:hypothetical protein
LSFTRIPHWAMALQIPRTPSDNRSINSLIEKATP